MMDNSKNFSNLPCPKCGARVELGWDFNENVAHHVARCERYGNHCDYQRRTAFKVIEFD